METGRENSSTRRPGARLRLFMSYRRRPDSHSARLLKNELTRAFGEGTVFRDVDDIEPGAAFPEAIREAVESSDVFLLLISPGWVELMGELRDPEDFVRREIAAALARGVPLVPLLLGGARVPEADRLPEEIRDLAFRQALELSDDRWDYDVGRLVKLVRARAARLRVRLTAAPPSWRIAACRLIKSTAARRGHTRQMRQRHARLALLLFTLLAFSQAAQAQTLEERLKEIDEYAARAGRDWKVPGFSVAVVKDDRVVFVKGYGVRELGRPEPVDKDTLFAVASNTKAFTSAALATLVDEGKLKWDDPVTKYLPYFQLYDPYVTRELTVRDLLSHRSGLATFGGDLLWYETTYSREEIIRRVRHLKPTHGFRSRYGYQNIMFLAAGEIVPAVTGKSFDDYVRERFFAPLGMTRTNTTYRQLTAAQNVATPHNETGGRVKVVKYSNVDSAGGAAVINSTAAEMAEWVRLQLGRGTYQGKRFFSAAASREMWSPHTIVSGVSESAERFNPTVHFNLYGLGWALSDYRGRKVVTHSGGLDGMTSRVALMPEENLGVVILTNSETPLQAFLYYKVFDVFTGAPPRDWSADYLARVRGARERDEAEAKKAEEARAPNTKPSLPLPAYAGTYGGQMYGDARVTEEQGRLVVRLVPSPAYVGDLEHWHFDTFRIKWRESVVYPYPRGWVTFHLDPQGKVSEMKIDVPNPDFDFKELEFRRAPDARR